jgi:membrane-associated phospholipid phosphatase
MVSAGRLVVRHYTFVDHATQGYTGLVVVLIALFHNSTVPHWGLLLGAHASILFIVHVLIEWHGRGTPNKAVDFLRHFYPVLLYTFFFCETGMLNRMFFADYLDPMVIRWEQALFGGQPSVVFMQELPYLAVSELFYASYFSYYVMISGVGIALFIRNREQFFHYVSVISFIFYVCYLIYIFIPVIGPRVFFREIAGYNLSADLQQLAVVDYYPQSIESGPFFHVMAWIYRTFESPGAAFPSSHVAIALCTVYFSFLYLRKIRFLHLAVAVLLCLATVYCRYHYAVDVLGGVLTAVLLLPIGNHLYRTFERSRS